MKIPEIDAKTVDYAQMAIYLVYRSKTDRTKNRLDQDMRDMMTETPAETIKLRKPDSEDGSDIWSLIQDCAPLDENSMYCNLIQCDHFRDTCVLAEMNGKPVGWISAYVLPDDAETLFIWQVAVSEAARGRGLASRMMAELLDRDACADVTKLQTTITKDNDASWALFTRFADRQDASIDSEPHFTRDEHFDGEHATEHMVTIELSETEQQMTQAA